MELRRFDTEEECRDTCAEPSGSIALNEVRVRQAGNGVASLLPAVIQVTVSIFLSIFCQPATRLFVAFGWLILKSNLCMINICMVQPVHNFSKKE